jgi:hypothetical protein
VNALTEKERQAALLRRRVEFVIKYPALVRLIPKGQHARLATALCARLQPAVLAGLQSQTDYDAWLTRVVEEPCWGGCTRGRVEDSRWSLIAKLINIIVYEIVVNRELITEEKAAMRLWPWLHLPLDRIVLRHLQGLCGDFPKRAVFKRMTKAEYQAMQRAARALAQEAGNPPIWYEAAWSMERNKAEFAGPLEPPA